MPQDPPEELVSKTIDHPELSALYPTVKKEELGEWLQEDERQKIKAEKAENFIAGIRPKAPLIGLLIAVPFILSSILLQLLMLIVGLIVRDNAMVIVFGAILVGLIYTGILIATFKKVIDVFSAHRLRASYVTITILVSIFLVSMPLSAIIGSLISYIVYLLSITLLSIVLSTVLIYIWTIKNFPSILKIVALLATLTAAALVYIFF